jgi:uncharacterized protein (DUF1778 family)
LFFLCPYDLLGVKKPPEKVKAEVLQIRLSSAEKQAFALAAELDGKKVSEWVRDRLRRDSRQELEAHGQPVPFLPSNKAAT